MGEESGRRRGIGRWLNRGPAVGASLTFCALAFLLSALISHYESTLLFKSKSDAGVLLEPHCNSLSLSIANRLYCMV